MQDLLGELQDAHVAEALVRQFLDQAGAAAVGSFAGVEAYLQALVARQAKKRTFREEYTEALRKELFFLDWATVLFTSAKTGKGVSELFRAIDVIEKEMQTRAETPELNRLLIRALDSYPPPRMAGRRFKILYAFQKPGRPPAFTLFINDARLLTPHYKRFLVDKIRATWGFTGCPVVFELRPREQKILRSKPAKKLGFVKK